MKILVIQQKMIGDVLTSSILFEALREKYPEAELHYLINAHTLPVVENNPFIDKFVLLSSETEKNYFKLFYFIKQIRNTKYDIVIDAYSKLSSNLFSLFSKAKTKISYHKKHRLFIYDYNINRQKHNKSVKGIEISNRLKLLSPLNVNKESIKPKIYLTTEEVSKSKNYLAGKNIDLNSSLFMISVLGSDDTKTYPHTYMSKLIDVIVEQTKGQVLFNYMPSQKNKAKNVLDSCKPKTQKHVFFNVFGNDLREFLAITKHCNALIGNEGGAINMAKAMDVPTFSIFSPWINKVGWNIFEDKKHVSLHLVDTKPELFENKTMKEIKNNYQTYYEAFLPEHIIPKLETYLKQFN